MKKIKNRLSTPSISNYNNMSKYEQKSYNIKSRSFFTMRIICILYSYKEVKLR